MPPSTQHYDSARRIQQRWRCQIGTLRVPNRTLLSISVAVFLAVLLSALAKAQGDSSSNSPTAVVQASVSIHPINIPVVSGSDISFKELANVRGLSQTRVLQIVQDDQGFMWFGTQYGLDRYDGYEFRVFTPVPGRVNSLSGAYIYSLFKDRAGMLWIGCDQFLDRFDPTTEKFNHYRIGSDASSRVPLAVVHISQDRSGTLWLSTGGGLYGFDPGTGQITHRYIHDAHNPSSLSSNDLRATGEDRSGRFWVLETNHLEEFDRETGKVTVRAVVPESGGDGASFYEDHLGTFWIVYDAGRGGGGLATFDRDTNKITNLSLYDSRTGKMMPVGVVKMLEDENGTLWFASEGEGLLRFDRKYGRMISYRNQPGNVGSIAEDRVIALAEDHQGNIFASFHARAPNVFSIKKPSFSPLLRPSLSPNRMGEYIVNAVYEDREGVLWVGITGSLLRIDPKNGEYTFYRPSDSVLKFDPTAFDPTAIMEDRLGTLWVGTVGQGLYRFNRSTGEFHNYVHHPDDPSSLSDSTIIRIFIDRVGRMWLATRNGLDRFDPSTENFVTYKRDVQSGSENYFDIDEDRNGGLWLGGTSGLQHFDPIPGKFTGYEHRLDDPHSLSDNQVTSVHIDHSGTVWVATESGLGKLNLENGRFTSYFTKDGLPSDRVNCILEDQRGNLWMSTNRGISRFDPVAQTFKNYSTADGLPGMDFTGWLTCSKGPTGRMFFGGFSGATSFYPDRVVDSAYVPPIVFTDFRLFGRQVEVGGGSPLKKSISYVDDITLSHQQSSFAVEFAALSYSDNTINRYRYKLDGLDQQWNETGSDQRMVNYAALPAGEYTFQVQTATGQSGWGLPGATLRIQVLPPWWRTQWFRVTVAAAILFLVWGVYHIRVRSIERHYRERRQAEEALRQAHADLIRANRVSSMGELTASLAHEVNQPIAAAVTNAHACVRWLARDQPILEEAREAASRMVKDANHAAEIIKRVRLLFKKGTPERELVDLNEVIREMIVLLYSEATQFAVFLRAELAAGLPRVMGDRVQLQQVLMNLMMNSIDAMKDVDGVRELTIQSQWGENGAVLISVSDTGVGLPPQQADKIFNAFFTTKTHGTGMGLQISRSIIESNGGRLWAAGNSPRGARFSFTLPASDQTRDPVVSGDRTGTADGVHADRSSFESVNAGRPTQRE
jgi:signal transduction histidine kinase/ligand-binding sensor domain-containing protein